MGAVAAIRAGKLLKDGVEHGHCRCVGPSRSSKLERHDHSDRLPSRRGDRRPAARCRFGLIAVSVAAEEYADFV
jgi:hypothetical protein